jgi:hypothetical protein
MTDTRNATPIISLASSPQWLTGTAAADTLGVSLRTLQRMATRGEVERRSAGRRSLFCVSDALKRATNDTTRHATRDTFDTTRDTAGASHSATEINTLRGLLDDAIAARVDAERRASVAEYRVAIAETDPAVVEGLRASVAELEQQRDHARAELATVTDERDRAREHAHRLADAMRKRYALIRRLLSERSHGS